LLRRSSIGKTIKESPNLVPIFLKLERVISLLAQGKLVPASFCDHALKGQLQGARECHIGPDWLLVYAKDEDCILLLLMGTGDHWHALGIE
jgi:mRNA interferase YafQ